MKYHPKLNFNCLNNIYCSLNEVENFLRCASKAKKIKKTYTLFKQWNKH